MADQTQTPKQGADVQVYENISITSLAFGGAGIGRMPNGKAVFVAGACPGDVLDLRIIEEKKNYAKACVEHIAKRSDSRIEPTCTLASNGSCGGCPWAHISYEQQLFWKRQALIDAFVRLGHFDAARIKDLVQPIIASDEQLGYRNKIEFSCGTEAQKLVLGMHEEGGQFNPVKNCQLVPSAFTQAPKALAGALRYVLKDEVKQLLRVGLRISQNTGDVEVALWTKPDKFPRAMAAQVIQDAFAKMTQEANQVGCSSKKALKNVEWCSSKKTSNKGSKNKTGGTLKKAATNKVSASKKIGVVRVITKDDPKLRKVSQVEVLQGRGFWRERLAEKTLKLSAPSFFQVNTTGAEHLVQLVMDVLQVESCDTVADLYCGAGTFTLPLAQTADSVYAVEMEGSSVRDLRRNLQDNNLDACVIAGDVGRELINLPSLDKVVVDPPRTGLDKKIIAGIANKAPSRIVYVSCNPTTLARDVAYFEQHNYALQSLNPVDLFPQTYHVETVCLLSKLQN